MNYITITIYTKHLIYIMNYQSYPYIVFCISYLSRAMTKATKRMDGLF